MSEFFMRFHVLGEVAETLLLSDPQPRLLVDLSTEPARAGRNASWQYPNRVSFTLSDPALIARFQDGVSVGDLLEATGTFQQGNYVPHHTGHIDTVFEMLEFQCHQRVVLQLQHNGQVFEPNVNSQVH